MGWSLKDLVKTKKDVVVVSSKQWDEIMKRLELRNDLKSQPLPRKKSK